MPMDEFLRPEAGLPSGELRIALIREIEIIQADLLHHACAVEDVPDLFSQPADDQMSLASLERFVEMENREAH